MGRLAALIELSEKERGELEGLSRRRRTAQGLAQRAQIVLLAADGLENKAIAERAGAVENTVGKWRRRFAEKRLDGLLDEPRPGRPREIGDDEIAETVRLTLETTPKDATHLEPAVDGRSRRSRALDHPSHLESLRPAAAPRGKLQAFDRSPVRGEGARYCRALYGAARACAGPVRRREEPDPGARPQPAGVADAPGSDRTAQSRLYAPWRDVLVRSARHRHRTHHWQMLSPPSLTGVPPLPRRDRSGCSQRHRHSSRHGQLRHAQDQ